MKIVLIGYGKMGKAIESIALERGHQVIAVFNSKQPFENNSETRSKISGADVAIEFTQPQLATQNIEACLAMQLPVVVGTTAWQEELENITAKVNAVNGSLLHASNFSVGVNIVFALNKKLASLMKSQTDYKVSIEEIHHTQKLDAPSGTAVSLALGIMESNPSLKDWKLVEDFDQKNPVTVPIKAVREPEVPGTHIVRYTSEIDTIELAHYAHNRKGFALGAVIAAEFLADKKGIYTMSDVLNI